MTRSDALLTSAEVADRLGVSEKTLGNWRTRRYGPPFIRLSGAFGPVRYRPADVDAWEERRLTDPEAPKVLRRRVR
ncbi:helix-turn-helix domain-containing protein [Streptomyces sp. ZAF1911]|uniref:helix-turn-helix transcriptional regulator n=1 Tax=Streptomyces sp. ZAF1911 TaxID=2944129 RepID=UPI00237C212E|nr:helix-turn-helix domain-containing protein [Streptomyces sp. ZAF1911]MDD9376537.1 helix-turn-helix domain-containing protein [Streptomyces sp. ZAF1911]